MLRNYFFIISCLILFACTHAPKNIEAQKSASQLRGERIATLAETMLGVPYKYGGDTPNGFDCSGLVLYTHNKVGIRTPRTSLQQFKHAKDIPYSQLRSGDLVFFKLNKHSVSHVGIYIGEGRFIHATKSGKHVSVDTLYDRFWKPRFVSAGRFY